MVPLRIGQGRPGAAQGARPHAHRFEAGEEPGARLLGKPEADPLRGIERRPVRKGEGRPLSLFLGPFAAVLSHLGAKVRRVFQNAALMATVAPAIKGQLFEARTLAFRQEVVAGDQDIQVLPGKWRRGIALAQVVIGVETDRGEGLLPAREIEVLAPGIHAGATAPRLQQGRPNTAITSREDPLEIGCEGIMPAELHAAAQALGQDALLRLCLREGDLPLPLEGRVRPRHEGGDAQVDARIAPEATPVGKHAPR